MTTSDYGKNWSGRRRIPAYFFIKIILSVLVNGFLVMLLWNAILPDLLNWKTINYWQAVGIILLSRILLGNLWPGGGPRSKMFGGPPPHIREKWKNMTDEERARFREEWRKRCAEKK